jgi:predicted porin
MVSPHCSIDNLLFDNRNFILENGLALDTGTQQQAGRLFGRQALVGLKGAFGTVTRR